jgi:hypothetical protein
MNQWLENVADAAQDTAVDPPPHDVHGIIANTVSPINNQRAEFDHIQSATRTNKKIHPAVPFSNCHQAIKEGTHTFVNPSTSTQQSTRTQKVEVHR